MLNWVTKIQKKFILYNIIKINVVMAVNLSANFIQLPDKKKIIKRLITASQSFYTSPIHHLHK